MVSRPLAVPGSFAGSGSSSSAPAALGPVGGGLGSGVSKNALAPKSNEQAALGIAGGCWDVLSWGCWWALIPSGSRCVSVHLL